MWGLGLIRFLPPAARPLAAKIHRKILTLHATRKLTPRVNPVAFNGRKVVVAGLFGQPTGFGRTAAKLSQTLSARGHEVVEIDLSATLGGPPPADRNVRALPRDFAALDASDLVIHVNPPKYLRALSAFPRPALDKCCVAAVWFWELQTVPQYWNDSAPYCDELWCFSPFVFDAMKNGLGEYRERVKLKSFDSDADAFAPPSPDQRAAALSKWQIASGDFVIGYSFAMQSSYHRKNPLAVVEAFRRAFPGESNARLILRCPDLTSYAAGERDLRAVAASDRRVVLTADMPLTEFYQCLDLYLALHRSEGFGHNLLEAAQSNIPVIATGWNMPPELAEHPRVRGVAFKLIPLSDPQGIYADVENAVWAEPDMAEAVRLVRALAHERRDASI